MIDIIIPAYNAHKTIEQTLFSIAYQDISDKCNIYIINDASDKDYNEIVEFFNKFINVKELILKENKGPGYARQYGIDNSNGEYIVFIDSDDVFSSPFSLKNMYEEIKDNKYDIVATNSVEETDNEFILKPQNTIWLHGKIYKRDFIKKHNIQFNDSRQNEDNGFNQLLVLCGAKIKFVDIKTYIWRNNEDSITRKNNNSFRFSGLFGYVYNISWALDEGIKRNVEKDGIAELSYMALLFIYYTYLEFYKNKEINDLLMKTKKIREISLKYPVDEDKKIELIENQFDNYYDDYTKQFILNPICTFEQFLNILDKETL